MNYEPYVGYWFYGGVVPTQTASYYCSWGLLDSPPIIKQLWRRTLMCLKVGK